MAASGLERQFQMFNVVQLPEISDIVLTPGPKGSLHIESYTHGKLISINTGTKPSLTILGETFELETLKQMLVDARGRVGNCTCPLQQIVARGCTCGGK